MTISEAEEYISNHAEDYIDTSFVVSESETDAVILSQPAFVFPEHNIFCFEGVVHDKESNQADYSITAVFYSGELDYIEEDGVAVTLHNYFTILDKNVDVYKLKCELKTMLIEDITE